MNSVKVVVLGGAPLTGKSTVARMLAARLGFTSICIDDLGQAIRAVTTTQSHPAFHLMHDFDYREYYVSRSIEELVADANLYHEAIWPAAKQLIIQHASWGNPAVIEGWAVRPESVATLALDTVQAIWLVASRDVLEARLCGETGFYHGASDEDKMIRHFVERSGRHDERIRAAAAQLGMPTIEISASTSIEEACQACLRALGAA